MHLERRLPRIQSAWLAFGEDARMSDLDIDSTYWG